MLKNKSNHRKYCFSVSILQMLPYVLHFHLYFYVSIILCSYFPFSKHNIKKWGVTQDRQSTVASAFIICDCKHFFERGQIILMWILLMKDTLVDFFLKSSFDLVIMCVLCFQPWQMEFCRFLLRAGIALISFKFMWKLADSWPYLIHAV